MQTSVCKRFPIATTTYKKNELPITFELHHRQQFDVSALEKPPRQQQLTCRTSMASDRYAPSVSIQPRQDYYNSSKRETYHKCEPSGVPWLLSESAGTSADENVRVQGRIPASEMSAWTKAESRTTLAARSLIPVNSHQPPKQLHPVQSARWVAGRRKKGHTCSVARNSAQRLACAKESSTGRSESRLASPLASKLASPLASRLVYRLVSRLALRLCGDNLVPGFSSCPHAQNKLLPVKVWLREEGCTRAWLVEQNASGPNACAVYNPASCAAAYRVAVLLNLHPLCIAPALPPVLRALVWRCQLQPVASLKVDSAHRATAIAAARSSGVGLTIRTRSPPSTLAVRSMNCVAPSYAAT